MNWYHISGILGCVILIGVALLLLIRKMIATRQFYESILDSLPFMITVTDLDRNWTFINKAVEDALGKKRKEVKGTQCSNWGAHICNTENCGIECLHRGETSTTFSQFELNFKVDLSFIYDAKGKKIGHNECVSNITDMVSLTNQLKEILESLPVACQQIMSSSVQVESDAQSLAESSSEQAGSVEELLASISSSSEDVLKNAEHAVSARDMSKTSSNAIEKSNMQMQLLNEAMDDINHKSNEIGKIIKTIEDIAFQTNILALNAAVEAARAGIAGKGFAVVADEVRNLASKSAEAAKNTTDLIQGSIVAVAKGTAIANETAKELRNIVISANTTASLIGDVSLALDRQTSTISQISNGVEQISTVVQSNAAMSEQSAAVAQELSSQVSILNDMVARFESTKELMSKVL